MVFSVFRSCEKNHRNQSAKLRRHDRPPDSIRTKKLWQQEDENHLKNERAQRGKDAGNHAVVERCKQRRAENVEANKQE